MRAQRGSDFLCVCAYGVCVHALFVSGGGSQCDNKSYSYCSFVRRITVRLLEGSDSRDEGAGTAICAVSLARAGMRRRLLVPRVSKQHVGPPCKLSVSSCVQERKVQCSRQWSEIRTDGNDSEFTSKCQMEATLPCCLDDKSASGKLDVYRSCHHLAAYSMIGLGDVGSCDVLVNVKLSSE
jgi:hypothetical protein